MKKQRYNLPVDILENIGSKYSPSDYHAFIAMGSGKLNRDRTRLYQFIKSLGYCFANYISSKAYIARTSQIGDNCFILENNVIQHNVKIGNNVILWSGNHIGHGTIIKDNCFISSHVVISGFCEINENTFIGVNSSIADYIKNRKR